jgi:hypothetical protein
MFKITVSNEIVGGQSATKSDADHNQSRSILLFQKANHLFQMICRVRFDRWTKRKQFVTCAIIKENRSK